MKNEQRCSQGTGSSYVDQNQLHKYRKWIKMVFKKQIWPPTFVFSFSFRLSLPCLQSSKHSGTFIPINSSLETLLLNKTSIYAYGALSFGGVIAEFEVYKNRRLHTRID